ncbi:MAG: glycosyltransferase N-terminal domain-containing protein [Bacteroidota bacterium]
MRLLYTLTVAVYHIGVLIASLFNKKAGLWVRGRRNLFAEMEKHGARLREGDTKLYWFHCASLGEFEQGRPLIEKMREQHPGCRILLTFFSPSGFEIRKNYADADLVCYLPVDYPSSARRFIELVRPDAVFFVKYEFWFNFIHHISAKKIPLYLVSANFREDQYFFKWYGAWARRYLRSFTHIFVQAEESERLLKRCGIVNVTESGDTRFDRVFEIARSAAEIPVVQQFAAGGFTIVAGSTWPKDEELLSALTLEMADTRLVIAPHEVGEGHLREIEQRFARAGTVRFSQYSGQDKARVMIIDNIGMLSSLYRYGKIAYIGGGFGSGIHNILEAAVYGMPVLFGPNHQKFREADELITRGGAFTVRSAEDMRGRIAFLLSDLMLLKMASLASENYVREKKGATHKILRMVALAGGQAHT